MPEFEKRRYQIELIEKIKQTNAILFLPTGSGKTFIALEIIKHMQDDLQKPLSKGGKRTIFLVNTVALVEQHHSFLKKNSSLRIKSISGDLHSSLNKSEFWTRTQNEFQVLIMTSQIYLNALTHAHMSLKNANLIICDECHSAVHDHPMRKVMTLFEKCDEKDHPKVLGLSATLLNANTTSLLFKEQLNCLENTFRSKIITSKHVNEVKKFSTKPKERREPLPRYQSPRKITSQIEALVEKPIDILSSLKLKNVDIPQPQCSGDKLLNDRGENRAKMLKNCLTDLMVHLEEYGLFFCYSGCNMYITQLERIMTEKKEEKVYCDALLMMINLLKVIRKLLKMEMQCSEDTRKVKVIEIEKNCAEKLSYLLTQLKNLTPSDKCIVFVQRRMTAKILSEIIKIFFKEMKIKLAVDHMIGSSAHPLRNSRDDAHDKKSNQRVMEEFRCGKINVLVASNVLEEGIDMPDCNAVFMYDFPKTFRSYVQSKGRARRADSSYVLLMDEEDEKSFKSIDDYQDLEKKLENAVASFDISHEFYDNNDEVYTTVNGAILIKTQAISIINRYCSSLSQDIFTDLTPLWWQNDERQDGCICKLQFPMNAAIKDIIEGPVCSNITDAKHAVAFKAVKILHEMNALDDHFHPVREIIHPEDEQYWFPYWNDKGTEDDGKKSSVREVDMKVPKYLKNCRPVANEKCYLHVIHIKPKYPKPTINDRKKCGELLTSPYELGIITKNRLPQVCDFPVFSDLGEVEISIGTNFCSYAATAITEEIISALAKFHREVFLKAIQVVKKFLVYSGKNDPTGYLIVPLKPSRKYGFEIDFDVVIKQWEIFDVEEPSEKQRKETVYDKNNYLESVLIPWYKRQTNSKMYYIVTNVDERKNLSKPFHGGKHGSFADYYEKKHNLKALSPNQPLMEARAITHNLDCLRPRGVSSEQSKKKRQEFFLVPEFCIKQTFPARYWYKATLLPTVLHRLHHLLLAEELREKIVIEAGIGRLEWRKNENDVLAIFDKYNIPKNVQNCEEDFAKVSISGSLPETNHLPTLSTLKEHTYEGPRQKEIFQALTPAGCNDILDLERLETLGDSFLKFAVSVTVFRANITRGEGYLTTLKSKLVGNRNLLYCGNRFNLASFIKTNTFSAHSNWCPPGFGLPPILKALWEDKITRLSVIFHLRIPYADQFSGILSKNTLATMKDDVEKFITTIDDDTDTREEDQKTKCFFGKQFVSDKTIADVVEALVGVYVKTGGIQPAYQLLNYFGILAKSKYNEVMNTQAPSPLLENRELAIETVIPEYKKLENLLSYRFRDKAYILQAFTHASYLGNTKTDCYQTLEFIGDAVLDFLITSYIYEYCGDLPPGKLTDLRSALVNNNTFGAISVRLGLHKFLLSDNEILTDAIDNFVKYQKRNNHQIGGIEVMKVTTEDGTELAEEVVVPKVLGDIFESLAGAIYLDSGNNLQEVWRIYYHFMKEEIEKFSRNIPINPKRAVYEIPNAKVKFTKDHPQLKKYSEDKMIMKLSVIKDNKEFSFYGRGENKHYCKRAAAKSALKHFYKKTVFVI
ncbi:endoribonuclease Dicer-like [Planococcus citri]|uniref:endoribonuclease Dicer-like n=1 Tax=Planococcus citri TaxID=170843 RepID=UPI0031FA2137